MKMTPSTLNRLLFPLCFGSSTSDDKIAPKNITDASKLVDLPKKRKTSELESSTWPVEFRLPDLNHLYLLKFYSCIIHLCLHNWTERKQRISRNISCHPVPKLLQFKHIVARDVTSNLIQDSNVTELSPRFTYH